MSLNSDRDPGCLVLVLDHELVPLWDPALGALAEELEERLDDVDVTFASATGAPTLGDALAAARYLGASWAAVGVTGRRSCPAVSAGLPQVTFPTRLAADAIVLDLLRARGLAAEVAAGG